MNDIKVTRAAEAFVPDTIATKMATLATAVAAVTEKQTKMDDAERNFLGARNDHAVAVGRAKNAYEAVNDAVKAAVPGIGPSGGRAI